MFALITAPKEVEAVVKLESVAKEPESKVPEVRFLVAYDQTSEALIPPPEVSVRVPFVHTSAARVPKVVSDLAVFAHTPVGMVARSDVDAVRTVALVLLLMVETAEEIWELVLVLMFEANDVEAARTVALVLELTADVPAAMREPTEVEALRTAVLVLPLTTAAIDDEAVLVLLLIDETAEAT